MSLTWGSISHWDEKCLIEAAEDLRTFCKKIEDAQTTLANARRHFISTGLTSEAIRWKIGRLQERIDLIHEKVTNTMMAFARASDGVAEVRRLVLECQQYAQIEGIGLDQSTGEVDDRTDSLIEISCLEKIQAAVTFNAQAMRRLEAADNLRYGVKVTLRLARQVDQNLKQQLQHIDAQSTPQNEPAARDPHSHKPQTLPKPEWSVSEVSLWWSSLSVDEKDWMAAVHPEMIGNLDGVEFKWRDQANRTLLDRHIAENEEIEAKYGYLIDKYGEHFFDDALTNPFSLSEKGEWKKAHGAREMLSHLRAAKRALETDDTFLLSLDLSGHSPKAAISIGNVDNADHIGVFVPGMGTRMNTSIEGYVDDAARINKSSMEELTASRGARQQVATVAWLGYDAPAELGHDNFYRVAGTSLAEAGADRLNSFVEGVHRSHDNARDHDPHITVMGHSYGSTTSGIAASRIKPGMMDDLVLFASPGSGVHSVKDYNITADHPYVAGVPDAQHDIVQGLGPDFLFGKNPMKMEGFEHLSNYSPGGDDSGLTSRHGTGTYLHKDSDILTDIASVVAGTKENK